MISVNLVNKSEVPPLKSASQAGRTCYSDEIPDADDGKMLDVEGRLFDTGHHTTCEHFYMSYAIEGIAVGDVTFGLHLAHPFYNSDQRSGRFCGKMFTNPDRAYTQIASYLSNYWPLLDYSRHREVMNYVCEGVQLFNSYLPRATEVAERWIAEDRPFASKFVRASAAKFAQEQLRMFIPVIFPTGLIYTIDPITLASMYRAAWSPPLRCVTGQMADALITKYPEVGFMFGPRDEDYEWAPEKMENRGEMFLYTPRLDSLEVKIKENKFIAPAPVDKHPIDLLRFRPEFMDNSVATIETRISISLATMGQDQRHRTIERGIPQFTGEFYIPPIMAGLGAERRIWEQMCWWLSFKDRLPPTLWMILAPYGAVVSYEKRASLNAMIHEQAKRLCWSAQEEIYHLGREMRQGLLKQGYENLADLFPPHCFFTGRCAEGKRFCGRDRRLRHQPELYFPERRI